MVATKDGTVVTVNGVALTPTLQAGEMTSFDIEDFHYIESNQDIYVYQFSSVQYELGSALVPSINCTGSTSVSFSRIYDAMFAVQIMTQKKNLTNFNMTPSNLLSNLTWNWVEGSGSENEDDTWYAAIVSMNPSTNTVYTITNGGLFHLSVLDANGSSMSYGYFSSFNNLRIDGPTMGCVGEDIILSTDQSPDSLTWYYD
ncbi:MAG TPA: peptidase, partial [Epulopiscium sp.]|nr:peptidase [Candidatus Epulonipiscium sp.]